MKLTHATVLTADKLAGIEAWQAELDKSTDPRSAIHVEMIDDMLAEIERLDDKIGAGEVGPGAQADPSAPYTRNDLTVALMLNLAGMGQLDCNDAGTLVGKVAEIVEGVFGDGA